MNKKMVQYSVWPNCNNNCKFCLRKERGSYTKDEQLKSIRNIITNIQTIDWNEFPFGISLLGGEMFMTTDEDIQNALHHLVDVICKHILEKSVIGNLCKLSTVTNGIYDPTFLFSIADQIKDNVGIEKFDLNFSYDLKYRYKNESDRLLVLDNINQFHTKYNYSVGVQMILTQYVIDQIRAGTFDIQDFCMKTIPGNILTFLYPHPIATGFELSDFNFKRADLLWLLNKLRSEQYQMYLNFIHSTKNSAIFKYTGLKNKFVENVTHTIKDFDSVDCLQMPVLSDGKEDISNECGHSTLYRCYADSTRCMLCDIINFDRTTC